jgi:hypothetical protein
LTVNNFLELIFIYLKKHEIKSVYKMSYFDSENDYDPWAPVNSAPAYSFSGQPAAPEPSYAAPQPGFSAPQPAFAGQNEAPQQASSAPPPPFAAPPPAFAAPQPNQGKVQNLNVLFYYYDFYKKMFKPSLKLFKTHLSPPHSLQHQFTRLRLIRIK